jgi:hypothetical protein
MIFPNIQIENVVQENDKTRIDSTKSFISKDEDAITLVEIEAESGSGFIEVGGPGVPKDWYLDWQYATDGTKTVSTRITTDGAPVTSTSTLEVVDATDDALFSSDSDLVALEHDILKWVPAGRNTFKNYHRKSQALIMAWLDESGYTDISGDRLTKEAFVDKEEITYYSAALTLSLIFSSISNDVEDVFMQKAKQYDSMALAHRSRLILRLDTDGDGNIDSNEGVSIKTLSMVRR